MRIPVSLRAAAEHLHVAPSTTALTADALRSRPEALVLQAALDDHYRQNPKTRPALGDLAVAAAEIDEHPLAVRPEVLRRAAEEVVKSHPQGGGFGSSSAFSKLKPRRSKRGVRPA